MLSHQNAIAALLGVAPARTCVCIVDPGWSSSPVSAVRGGNDRYAHTAQRPDGAHVLIHYNGTRKRHEVLYPNADPTPDWLRTNDKRQDIAWSALEDDGSFPFPGDP